jgi:hypothetical protein
LKSLFFILLLSIVKFSHAECDVFIPIKDFWHAGYVIHFDLDPFMKSKNLVEVYDQSQANSVLRIKGFEVKEKFFNYAHSEITVTTKTQTYIYQDSKRCLTQLCGVSDFTKTFNRSLRKMIKGHPECAP